MLALAALGVAALVASTAGGRALPHLGRALGCQGFVGETVQAVAWSEDGRYLAVSSIISGTGTTRVFEWPAMVLRTQAATDISHSFAAIADDGTIFWMSTDPFSALPEATTFWKQGVGGQAQELGSVSGRWYLALSWAGDSLVAEETRAAPEGTRLVQLSLADLAAEPVALTDWQERAGEMWIDRTGAWTAWIDPAVPSNDPKQIVVRHGGEELRLTLPGYGGRVPTLTPARDAAIYQRSETALLTVVSLASGALLGELDPQPFYGGEVSAQGILAAPTSHGPGESNELCVLDVGPRLVDMAAS